MESANAAAIERVELFRSMPPDARQALSRVLRSHHVSAGEWLFRQGDPGDALYIVRSGRLELVASNPDSDVVVRLRGPGAVIGELALLDGGHRATSARALRDSQLWRLDRTDFAELRGTEPSLDDGLIRVMADKLRQVGDLTTVESSSVKVLAMATVGGSDGVRATTGALIDALGTSRSLAVLDAGPQSEWPRQLDDAEREHDLVLLPAGDVADESSAWSQWCSRQTDTLLVVIDGEATPSALDPTFRPDLVIQRTVDTDVRGWSTAVHHGRLFLIRDGSHRRRDAARAARHLLHDATGLVLSGGGARAFAHIGVLHELELAGVEVDRVGGTSMGAFIAGLYALGRAPGEIEEICRTEFASARSQWVLPVRRLGQRRAQKLHDLLARHFGQSTIESLPIPFFCISADLISAEVVAHRRGTVADAIQASMSLPGVFPAWVTDQRLLVDGGVLNNLPIDVMASDGGGRIIAVDVMSRGGRDSVFDPHSGYHGRAPTTLETLVRAATLGSWRWTAEHRLLADVLIAPDAQAIGLLDFDQIDRAVAAGRRAAQSTLAKSPTSTDG